jgi:hypothetical protein
MFRVLLLKYIDSISLQLLKLDIVHRHGKCILYIVDKPQNNKSTFKAYVNAVNCYFK